MAGESASADWVNAVVDACEVWTGVEGVLSFEDWVGAAMVLGNCFGGLEEADWTQGELLVVVVVEEGVEREGELVELWFGHKVVEQEVVDMICLAVELGVRTGDVCFTG